MMLTVTIYDPVGFAVGIGILAFFLGWWLGWWMRGKEDRRA